MRHPTEDDLILHHYGEAEGAAQIEAHLSTCEACRASRDAMGRMLAAVETQEVPERGEGYGAAVWARIAPKLAGSEPAAARATRRSATSVTQGPWRRFLMPAALAASLVGAFWLGRHWPRGAGDAQPLSGPVRERILVVAVGDHLERSQIVLVELTHAKGNGSVDISAEQRLAQELVDANRLYRQTAVRAGESGVASVLDDLERVLIDIATGPSTLSSAEFETVRRRIEERGILFKVRVVGSQMRERERESRGTSNWLHEGKHMHSMKVLSWGVLILGLAVGPADAQHAVVSDVADREQERAQAEKEKAQRDRERKQQEEERAQQELEREDQAYERGTDALDEGRWERALRAFEQVAERKGKRAEAALYWKAYAQNKLGQRSEALATLQALRASFPSGRWTSEAKALEVEVQQASGRPPAPEGVADEELKIMALNGLLNTDPERALPLLEKFLQGGQSPKLKDKALFVLCQSGSPRAREIVAQIARGKSNPAMQAKAIKYLGSLGGAESRQVLSEIYAGAEDLDVKKAILRAFMVGGDRARVLAAAKGEKVPELRRDAIHQLGVMGAQAELWELYGAESSVEAKKAMIQAMFVGGNADRLIELARGEKDPELRLAAVQKLGVMGSRKTGDALVALYASEKDRSIREQVIQSLFVQGNAKSLVELARKEQDRELKRAMVEKLSHMNSKEGTDFLLEILNK